MSDTNGVRDFDFLVGSWRCSHRKLKQRLAGSREWVTFDGELTNRPILGGMGNFEECVMDDPGGRYHGAAVRQFDPAAKTWSIFWFDERFTEYGEPMVGQFDDGIGTFLCNDTFEGKPIVVRFEWHKLTPETCRWEQAFSLDGGMSWETNWIMTFVRET